MTFVPEALSLTKNAGHRNWHGDVLTHALTSEGHDASEDGTGRGTPLVAAPVIGFFPTDGRDQRAYVEQSPPLKVGTGLGIPTAPAVQQGMAVRRLTPIECARLQGFPDDWLEGNDPPDSPKYAALGDAVTVSVSEWIGRRLMESTSRLGGDAN